MEKTIGFIGLGFLGLSLVFFFFVAGYHLQVYNRTADRANELDVLAITKCQTPAEAAANVPVVITMLADDNTVKECTVGKDGLLSALQKGGVHISMSTISPDISKSLSDQHIA